MAAAAAGATPSQLIVPFIPPHCLSRLPLMDGFVGFWKLGPPPLIFKEGTSLAGVGAAPLEPTSLLPPSPGSWDLFHFAFGGSPGLQQAQGAVCAGAVGPQLLVSWLAQRAGGNVLLGNVCLGCCVLLNGPATRLGNWWPSNTLSPPGPGAFEALPGGK